MTRGQPELPWQHSPAVRRDSTTSPISTTRGPTTLPDILAIALCATLADADGFVDMERFGTAKRTWFERWLDLRGGVLAHDTFGRVFAALDA